MNTDGLVIGGIIAAMVACLAVAIAASINEEREWSAFAKAQSCVVVGKATGDTFTTIGIGSNGQPVVGVGSTAAKTGYKCNDGVTYWR